MRESFPFQNTKKTMERLASMVERDLLEQVPQRGANNPYATGDLKRSLNVSTFNTSDDEWTIAVTYDQHGNYTNFGTRVYSGRWQQLKDASFFDLPRFAGYKRGKGGIRPQYWLSLSRQENKYLKELEKSIELDFDTFINKVIENLSKPL